MGTRWRLHASFERAAAATELAVALPAVCCRHAFWCRRQGREEKESEALRAARAAADKAPRPPVERCRSCFHFLMSRAHAVAVARGFPLLLGCRPRQPAWKTAAESGGCTAAAPSDVAAVWALCFFSRVPCCVRGSDRPLGQDPLHKVRDDHAPTNGCNAVTYRKNKGRSLVYIRIIAEVQFSIF